MIEISVVIATYNVAPYIARAVSSALTQEEVKLEVIVVDDCSTDETWQIISAIADPRVRTRRNHENCGPSVTRNEAIAMANGKWIAVLDGDDEFLAGRLARCLARAQMAAADIVVDNIEIRREADEKTDLMFGAAQLARIGRLDLAHFIAGNHLFARSHTLGYMKPIFSADFLRRHGLAYDPALRIGEDYLLLAEALAKGAVCAVEPVAGYAYTVRAGSISHRLALADIERMQASDEKFLATHILDKDAQKAHAQRANSLRKAYYFTLLVESLKRKDVLAATKILLICPGAAYHLWQPIVKRLKLL